MIADSERAVSHYLLDDEDVAALVGRRIVGKPPDSQDEPWVQVTWLTAANDANLPVDYLTTSLVQLDCYAGKMGGQPEAKLIARTVRAALDEMPEETFDEIEVTAVRFVGFARVPDTQGFEPARERVIITAQVTAHALEPVS